MTKEKLAIKLAIDIMERNVSKYINHGIYEVSDTDGAVHVEFAEAINILNEMLKQQPCEDAVSREDALDAINEVNWETSHEREQMERAIKDLPPVQPKSSWISVKDRLPNEGIAVLIYCPEIKCKFTAIRDLGAWHYFGGGCWDVVGWHVSDWMPLPEHEDDEEGE